MPIKTQNDLPAKEILENENIFVMDEFRAVHQDMRPLQVLILNNMPVKQDTELQLLRALSNTPLQVDVTFMNTKTHVSLNTPASHLNKFYTTFDEIRDRKFDGLIVTGAPVEDITFEEVVGQEHIIGKDKLLYRAIKADKISSIIFYGPPGTGKTTLAKVIANTTKANFVQMNATTSGKKDMQEAVALC